MIRHNFFYRYKRYMEYRLNLTVTKSFIYYLSTYDVEKMLRKSCYLCSKFFKERMFICRWWARGFLVFI